MTTPDIAALRRLLDDMRALATREGIYNGNRAVLDIIARVEPLLDDVAALRAELAHMTEARDNARVEVERLTALLADVRAAVLGEDSEEWTRMAGTSHMIAASYLLRILDGRADS